jgi:hypothetical protein
VLSMYEFRPVGLRMLDPGVDVFNRTDFGEIGPVGLQLCLPNVFSLQVYLVKEIKKLQVLIGVN